MSSKLTCKQQIRLEALRLAVQFQSIPPSGLDRKYTVSHIAWGFEHYIRNGITDDLRKWEDLKGIDD